MKNIDRLKVWNEMFQKGKDKLNCKCQPRRCPETNEACDSESFDISKTTTCLGCEHYNTR